MLEHKLIFGKDTHVEPTQRDSYIEEDHPQEAHNDSKKCNLSTSIQYTASV